MRRMEEDTHTGHVRCVSGRVRVRTWEDENSRQNGWRTALFLGGLTHAGGSWWARLAREWPELVQWDGCAFISREAATGLSAAGCGGMIAFSILRGHR